MFCLRYHITYHQLVKRRLSININLFFTCARPWAKLETILRAPHTQFAAPKQLNVKSFYRIYLPTKAALVHLAGFGWWELFHYARLTQGSKSSGDSPKFVNLLPKLSMRWLWYAKIGSGREVPLNPSLHTIKHSSRWGGKCKESERRDDPSTWQIWRMLLTTDSCVDNFIKVKWAPWQTDTTVKESKKRYRKKRHRERGGGKLSGRGTQTWCFIVSWPFKTTTIDDLFIYLWFLLINYWDIQIQVCVEIFARELYLYLFRLLPFYLLDA